MTQPASAPTVMAAAAALRSGQQTSESLTLIMLDRIAATDANVQAWAYLDRELVLEHARASDALRGAGIDAGPLSGIGIGVKDVIATGQQPTQLGSPIFAGAQPTLDADCVVRLKRAGGFVFGKTVTTHEKTQPVLACLCGPACPIDVLFPNEHAPAEQEQRHQPSQ